ncbi:Aste57867_23573 [Aphanomyces stellatus]|uniref:Aste57867_23573 protein n=1 Tax=Aphanomyces stellatus TaxID=120398 RepID=A0A485LNF4_9STRA|nr:hypothetical protein As57867_023502 [Aphanomyces stellatus]VFU00218.1 Aste57867_23573 [Aphanomyces stellatus]
MVSPSDAWAFFDRITLQGLGEVHSLVDDVGSITMHLKPVARLQLELRKPTWRDKDDVENYGNGNCAAQEQERAANPNGANDAAEVEEGQAIHLETHPTANNDHEDTHANSGF